MGRIASHWSEGLGPEDQPNEKRERRSVTLWGAAYEDAGDNRPSRKILRGVFLGEASLVVPGILTELQGKPLLLYRACDRLIDVERMEWLSATDADEANYPELVPLRESIRAWSRRFNLTD